MKRIFTIFCLASVMAGLNLLLGPKPAFQAEGRGYICDRKENRRDAGFSNETCVEDIKSLGRLRCIQKMTLSHAYLCCYC